MKILLLGEKSILLQNSIIKNGHHVSFYNDKLTTEVVRGIDFIISFGYKFIIQQHIIDLFAPNIINLHISYLPFNKGADPNLWSFLEDTPKGVTIHKIDETIDGGDILIQNSITFSELDTLKTSYDKLLQLIVTLFEQNVNNILNNKIAPIKQIGIGSSHKKIDKEKFQYLLDDNGYDTPIKNIIGKSLV